jgi:hypothetical protein
MTTVLTHKDIAALTDVYNLFKDDTYYDVDGDEVMEITVELFDQMFLAILDQHEALTNAVS